MSVLAGFNLRRSVLSTSPKSNQTIITTKSNQTIITTTCDLFFVYMNSRIQWFSSSSDSTGDEFSGGNAYDLLGVCETSSFAEIKAAFRKLAKETHPDLMGLKNASSASHRFVQILAAYEILSDIEKRAHYDRFLLSQRTLVHKSSRQGSKLYAYESHITTVRQMEVVEWLKWYRLTINDILLEKKVVVGSSYFDALEGEFYSAVRAAYYGPVIESWDLLPDRFEAEERSEYETPEVLHLVSGRDLFGMVCLVNKHPKLSYGCNEKLTLSAYMGSDMSRCVGNASQCMNSNVVDDVRISQMQAKNFQYPISEAYKDLELHLSGRVVAVATRVPPKNSSDVLQNDESLDHIHVFLNSNEDPIYIDKEFSKDSSLGGGSRVPLGTITGLGTCPDEGSCFVYNSSGAKTHVLMKHRTLLVKHMHWYQVGNKVSVCECRCSRARLPPSKLFKTPT